MIVVLGRPGLDAEDGIGRPAGLIALAATRAGGRVELVGSVGDDADGDAVIVELGRAGVGHAAVLRDPGGSTPREDDEDDGSMPRLDADDVGLGLGYLAECQVLVVAEPLSAEQMLVVTDAAAYHRAALVVLTDAGAAPPTDVPDDATLLEMPAEDSGAFSELVGRYAALLDAGRPAPDAWRDAIDEGGWEQSEG